MDSVFCTIALGYGSLIQQAKETIVTSLNQPASISLHKVVKQTTRTSSILMKD
ncbi:MAG: hypothetical protein ACOYME_13820 [Prochlorotrichaceae cyanobacterium]